MRVALALLVACLVPFLPQDAAARFDPGDLYLHSASFSDIGMGIKRIEPLTGAVTTHVDLPDGPLNRSVLTYDRTRDALLFLSGELTGGVYRVDALGAVFPLDPSIPTPQALAARGDGTIYTYTLPQVGYFDVFDVWHPLLDETGTNPVEVHVQIDVLHYDPLSNSLLVFDGGNANNTDCNDPLTTCVIQLRLDASGTQLAGPPVSQDVVVSPAAEIVVGASSGPDSKVMVVVDTNSNDAEPRMQLLDPFTLQFTPYASNGYYIGAASVGGGTYSSVLDEAVLVDTRADSLRAYSAGGTGLGRTFGAGIADVAGSCSLIEISPVLTAATPTAPGSAALSVLGPNPFSGSTTLRFELPAPRQTRLEVFDLRGRRVRVLSEGPGTAGEHRLVWDGRDAKGRRLPAGTYFARLRAGNQTLTRKVGLLR